MTVTIIPMHFLAAVVLSVIVGAILKPVNKLLTKPLYKLCDRKKTKDAQSVDTNIQ